MKTRGSLDECTTVPWQRGRVVCGDLPLFMVQLTVAKHQLFVGTWKVDVAKSPGAVEPPPSG